MDLRWSQVIMRALISFDSRKKEIQAKIGPMIEKHSYWVRLCLIQTSASFSSEYGN